MTFKHDRIENEKNEPHESSSFQFINVPIVLLALFIGFGVTYIFLKTENTSIEVGDSRTVPSTDTSADTPEQEAALTPEDAGGAAGVGSMSPGLDLAALMNRGKQIYTTTCQACHQANGEGIPSAFPPLAGSEWIEGSGKMAIAVVIHGLQGEITVKGEKFQSAMAPLGSQLSSEDIASVVTYVRNSFGNKLDPVSVATVDEVKEETKGQSGMWSGEAELKAKNWK